MLFGKDFNKSIQYAIDAYNRLADENKALRQELRDYDKEVHIQKLKEENARLYSHSLLQLSDKELEREGAFRDKHYHLHKPKDDMKISLTGSRYIYDLTGTGVGTVIKITCPICGESEDITDVDSW